MWHKELSQELITPLRLGFPNLNFGVTCRKIRIKDPKYPFFDTTLKQWVWVKWDGMSDYDNREIDHCCIRELTALCEKKGYDTRIFSHLRQWKKGLVVLTVSTEVSLWAH